MSGTFRPIDAEQLRRAGKLLASGQLDQHRGHGPKGLRGSSAAAFGIPVCQRKGCRGELGAYYWFERVVTKRGSALKARTFCRLCAALAGCFTPASLPEYEMAAIEAAFRLCRGPHGA